MGGAQLESMMMIFISIIAFSLALVVLSTIVFSKPSLIASFAVKAAGAAFKAGSAAASFIGDFFATMASKFF